MASTLGFVQVGFSPSTSRVVQSQRFSSFTSIKPKQAFRRPAPSRRSTIVCHAANYWQGEWVCIDCGYIYGPQEDVQFEDLEGSWRCPQCRAPKRRFAKKAGDLIASGNDTSNATIAIVSLLGLVAMVLFGVWAAEYL